jgi:class 3 adenylate cyclase
VEIVNGNERSRDFPGKKEVSASFFVALPGPNIEQCRGIMVQCTRRAHSRSLGCSSKPRRIYDDAFAFRPGPPPAPGFIQPYQPIVSLKVPTGPQWIPELKHDGFRIVVHKDGDRVHLWSRNGRERLSGIPLLVSQGWKVHGQRPLSGAVSDAELLRVNPLKFAADKGLTGAETVDLFLHAAALGVFDMTWVIVCPLCSCVIESFRALRNLDIHCRCTICHVDQVADLDDMIAVTFSISPAIRRTIFHDPDQLSVADYCFRYKSTMDGLAPDGTPFTAIKEKVTVALSYLAPGEMTEMEVKAESGLLRAYSPDTDAWFLIAVDPTLPATETRLSVRCGGETCDPADGTVAPGKLTLEITNSSSKRQAFGIFCIPTDFALPPLHFGPFLSGKQLLTTQTFRDLFRSEVIRSQEGLGVKDIALLFTDLKGSTALYDRIGDLNAFSLVQQHFDRLQGVTVRHNGAIIKTIGDAVMAAFLKPADAVQAALDMRSEIASFNERQPDKALILKIGIHKGAAIAVTLNDRLDYFGQTVNIAARVQNLADADEIFVSQDVYESAGVRDGLAPYTGEPRTAQLRGVQQELPVFRVGARAAHPALRL